MKLEELSAVELGQRVNNKEIKATEVIEYFKNRIESRNHSINAFTYTKFDDAFKEAEKIDLIIENGVNPGLLAGVPIGLKDFLPSKKGWEASHGGVPSLITVDSKDSEFYAAAKHLGCIAVGKTNAPAFGFRATTDNVMYGPTSTPFKVGYNSGGSSGGSCAAVADGLLAISETGDAGGSTRCPAAWCGVFGMKPSAGIIPSVCRPDAWVATHPYCTGSCATRTVRDSATVITEMIKYNPRDPLSVPFKGNLFDNSSIKGMKIAYTLNFDLFPIPDNEIILAIRDAVKLLRGLGAQVDFVTFDWHHSKKKLEDAWLFGMSIDSAIELELRKQHGYYMERDHKNEAPEEFFKWCKKASDFGIWDYRKFHEIRTDVLDSHMDILEKYDAILAPVTGCLPVKNTDDHDTKGPSEIGGEKVDQLIGFAYTFLENMIGTPAASVPFGLSEEGLPIGIQVIGKRYFDQDVFRVSYAIEREKPWSYEIPFGRSI